jgi:hypothetical protein
MLRERTPRRWLFVAVVALASAGVMPWAHARTDTGVTAISGLPHGAAEILVLAAVAAALLLADRAHAATYAALLATGFSALVVFNLRGALEYEYVWDTTLTAGPALALLGTVLLFVAAALRRHTALTPTDGGLQGPNA